MNNQKIIFLRGLPASGKSTFARQYCIDNPEFIRINKDDIREELGNPPFSRKFEDNVLELQRSRGLEILKNGKSLIVDDTNFSKTHEKFWRLITEELKIEFKIKEFNADLEECIRRDSLRINSVGKNVIENMYNKYIK